MSKFQTWYDSLPDHTKQYLKSQPIWHDRDLFKAFAFGIFIGIIVGVML
jgi:hypothetical protein